MGECIGAQAAGRPGVRSGQAGKAVGGGEVHPPALAVAALQHVGGEGLARRVPRQVGGHSVDQGRAHALVLRGRRGDQQAEVRAPRVEAGPPYGADRALGLQAAEERGEHRGEQAVLGVGAAVVYVQAEPGERHGVLRESGVRNAGGGWSDGDGSPALHPPTQGQSTTGGPEHDEHEQQDGPLLLAPATSWSRSSDRGSISRCSMRLMCFSMGRFS